MGRPKPTLSNLIELHTRLREDADASPQAMRDRDRQIAQDTQSLPGAEQKLLAWLEHTATESSAHANRQTTAIQRLSRAALAILALVLGGAAASAIFHYDGTHPVNVLHALGLLVGLNWLLLVFWIVAMLPDPLRRYIPGLDATLDALSILSPGKWITAARRWLPQSYRETLLAAQGSAKASRASLGRVSKWVAADASQIFAMGFYTAAAVTFLALVAFKDLAFAWSTTLDLSVAHLETWTRTLSMPWAWAWPAAQPDAALIEQTQYFRWHELTSALDPSLSANIANTGTTATPPDPRRFGLWWPFILMSLLVYGLVPRIVTCVIAGQRLQAAIRHAFIHNPGARAILQRMNAPAVRTVGQGHEDSPATPLSPAPLQPVHALDDQTFIIDWANAAGETPDDRNSLCSRLGIVLSAIKSAGGAQSPQDDTRLLESARQAQPPRALVLVKAWEPPMGELEDFLTALRAALGRDTPLEVAPLTSDYSDKPGQHAADDNHIAQWRSALGKLGDPNLIVLDIREARP